MTYGFLTASLARTSLCVAGILLAVSCVKVSRRPEVNQLKTTPTQTRLKPVSSPVSISRASQVELENLPGVGPSLASRIVEHRTRYGPFRRVEHLMMVRGISERRFRELRPFIAE